MWISHFPGIEQGLTLWCDANKLSTCLRKSGGLRVFRVPWQVHIKMQHPGKEYVCVPAPMPKREQLVCS